MSDYQRERFPFPSPGRLRRELRLPRPPLWLVAAVLLLFIPAGITAALIYRARHSTSAKPRIHLIQDMGVQPRYGPQAASEVFADGRATRAPVAGTIAQGQLEDKPHYHRGYETATDPATGQPAIRYFKGLPPEVENNEGLLKRGREQYAIYCGVCHGKTGDGAGPVNQTAIRNNEPKWVPAPSMMSDVVRQQPDGQLYNTIRNGIRNMPPYGSQIDTHDRWAIVACVRSLQQQTPATAPATQPATSPTTQPARK